MSTTEYISHHPIIALFVGLAHLLGAFVVSTMELPTIVMQLFQIGAWIVTIAVGLITLYSFYNKRK